MASQRERDRRRDKVSVVKSTSLQNENGCRTVCQCQSIYLPYESLLLGAITTSTTIHCVTLPCHCRIFTTVELSGAQGMLAYARENKVKKSEQILLAHPHVVIAGGNRMRVCVPT